MTNYSTDGWKPVSLPAKVGLVLVVAIIARYHATQDWVPILDDANLIFHEAGHPIFGLLGETIGIIGGTLGQLAFPVIVSLTFLGRKEVLGTTVGALWYFENWLNIARYMADARAQVLPLIGAGEHDWATMLSWWGLLSSDTTLAMVVRFGAWGGIIAMLVWAWFKTPRETLT